MTLLVAVVVLLTALGAVILVGVSLGLLTLFERVTAVTGVTGVVVLGEDRLTLAGRALTPVTVLTPLAGVFLTALTLVVREGAGAGLVSRGLVVGAAD